MRQPQILCLADQSQILALRINPRPSPGEPLCFHRMKELPVVSPLVKPHNVVVQHAPHALLHAPHGPLGAHLRPQPAGVHAHRVHAAGGQVQGQVLGQHVEGGLGDPVVGGTTGSYNGKEITG